MNNTLEELFNWFGHRKGGVKIAFTDRGNPAGVVIKTDLIHAIDKWLINLRENKFNTPRKIFFVGGPGNGKTEALDYAINGLIQLFGLGESAMANLKSQAMNSNRALEIDTTGFSTSFTKVKLIPDASLGDQDGKNAAKSMLDDFTFITDPMTLYICCINRGILQDVLDVTKDNTNVKAINFFSQLSTCLDTSKEEVKNTWPTNITVDDTIYTVGVWPMEVSSLFENYRADIDNTHNSPFQQVLRIAIENLGWAQLIKYYKENQLNSDYCPLLANYRSLSRNNGESLRNLIKEFELVSNRRITFREMLSMVVYALLGHEDNFNGEESNGPQQFITGVIKSMSDKGDADTYEKVFKLSMLQWEFKFFNVWPDISRITEDEAWKKLCIQKKKAGEFKACEAFQAIFTLNLESIQRTDLEKTLISLGRLLDPSKLIFRENIIGGFDPSKIDLDLQESVSTLYNSIKDNEALSILDKEVLEFLLQVELELDDVRSTNNVNSINSTIERLNFILKKITSAYVKRKMGAYYGISSETDNISTYDNEGNEEGVRKVIRNLLDISDVKKIEGKSYGDIKIGLNSTFGQPDFNSMDIFYESTISYSIGIYKPIGIDCMQPITKAKFLKLTIITDRKPKSFSMPLSFHFSKAIKDIGDGLKKGTLPRDIVATFDRMKSFLEGIAVHALDEDATICFPSGDKLDINKILNHIKSV